MSLVCLNIFVCIVRYKTQFLIWISTNSHLFLLLLFSWLLIRMKMTSMHIWVRLINIKIILVWQLVIHTKLPYSQKVYEVAFLSKTDSISNNHPLESRQSNSTLKSSLASLFETYHWLPQESSRMPIAFTMTVSVLHTWSSVWHSCFSWTRSCCFPSKLNVHLSYTQWISWIHHIH